MNTNTKKRLNKLLTLLGADVFLESAKLDNGTVVEAESFEAGMEVFIVSEGDRVALPIGEYTLEDGRELVVSEEGLIGEIKEASSEEDSVEPEVAQEEELQDEVKTQPKKVVETTEVHFTQADIDAKDKKIAELEAKIIELSEVSVSEDVVSEEATEEATEEETKLNFHNPLKNMKLSKEEASKPKTKLQFIHSQIRNNI
jgi:hypothetical protein